MVDSDRIHEHTRKGSRRQFARVYDTSDTVAVYDYAMRQYVCTYMYVPVMRQYVSSYMYVPVMRLVSK